MPVKFNEWYQADPFSETTHSIPIAQLIYLQTDPCDNSDMGDLTGALAGNRKYYRQNKSDRYSVTMTFKNIYPPKNINTCTDLPN
jgi:hypothetical protein